MNIGTQPAFVGGFIGLLCAAIAVKASSMSTRSGTMNGTSASRTNENDIRTKIESIPSAMRQMGWIVSAQLMERWLHSPAWMLPHSWKGEGTPDPRSMSLAHLDQRIVRMDWAKSHPRVRGAMGELRAKMANDAAKKLLRKRLADLAWGANTRIGFGSRQHSAIQLEQVCQSNWHGFGSKLDTMDDMYGSLGIATLKVALIGEAMRDARTGRLALRVTDAGFYIRDTYDFNGPQYLGTWTNIGVLNKAQVLANAAMDGMSFRWGKPSSHVSNRDFEVYRRTTGFGGDFVVYSDVLWENVNLLLELN
jgi:hypothetical protein